ncbi:triphosphoribosyl-dephospho-CoA synthase [Bathymodiolus platifrons methanotrophic gill symbiont]|uniref:triphosphoribosyl-dephospho-CoA synthase n=1 Tax=Bathymodiolus platifrons methanotrophic gill symbiont TaxID=113268 RepID=UPI000B41FE76|nr:triphosphoribosyl-dephospho-CoA synthase [Bathymodiolus platifrons methanotrophic gill symbiont]TXL14578.1 triphosphoribosyl-dephospho-CoA synthase [Methylococcaceae bacterium HT4]TXL19972.1 triphosphoribosyl-dephospho-CoA synthase [Methylococcaceae bacterium HT5]GAW86497.1 triphosphoribosyl-dephospho-CoA synthase [Bathymodiolus platifrons methanotrophic gill symbiont]GFO74718.1 triphosphoribosyl-dephospho-CoA synthase [Bathymodiolus platifrons methanotrophic gill symbiont]
MLNQQQLIQAYEYACEIELRAFKPGNVSVYADGHDMTVEDFRTSARKSSEPITSVDFCLGERIYYAVKATREAVGCNTNLGIILLCAPLLLAAEKAKSTTQLRELLAEVLATTSVEDAEWVFRAIALAAPGGLGKSDAQDVSEKPDVTLTQAMEIASKKDRIALQFITNYKDVFDFLVLRYNASFNRWGDAEWSAVAVYAAMLAKCPDSHIERKYGVLHTKMVMDKMSLVDDKLSESDRPEQLMGYLHKIDNEFKSAGINPGTTADFTVVTILAVQLEQLLSNK